jgi:hypothetical protein
MPVVPGHVGVTTTVLEAAATSIGAGILIGSFLTGIVGLVMGWSRQNFESQVLGDGYIGGTIATVLLVIDVSMRYFV